MVGITMAEKNIRIGLARIVRIKNGILLVIQ